MNNGDAAAAAAAAAGPPAAAVLTPQQIDAIQQLLAQQQQQQQQNANNAAAAALIADPLRGGVPYVNQYTQLPPVTQTTSPQDCMAAMANQFLMVLPAISNVINRLPDNQMPVHERIGMVNRFNLCTEELSRIRMTTANQAERAGHEYVVPIISDLPPSNAINLVDAIPDAKLYKLPEFSG